MNGHKLPARPAARPRWWRLCFLRRPPPVIEITLPSMLPTLIPGARAAIEAAPGEWLPGKLYAIETAEGPQIARAGRDGAGRALMLFDNPDWPSQLLPRGARVLGRVRQIARHIER